MTTHTLYWLLGVALACGFSAPLTGWWLSRQRREWTRAVPHESDPDVPTMSVEHCARLPGGHAWITAESRPWKSCARCGAFRRIRERYRDFDARR